MASSVKAEILNRTFRQIVHTVHAHELIMRSTAHARNVHCLIRITYYLCITFLLIDLQ